MAFRRAWARGRRAGGIATRICLGLLLAPGPVLGQQPPPFADFTFKTVRPPAPGSNRRITVQIAPQDQPAPPAPSSSSASPAAAVPAAPGRYGWFWQAIPPESAASGPGRLDLAMRALSGAPPGQQVPAPRLAEMVRIARAHQASILVHSVGSGVSPALILAVIAVESSGRTDAVSGAGAQGLMQLMPDTARRYGVEDPFDADQSIAGGTAFLGALLARFEGDPILALAGYNAGETQLALHEGVPDFAETRDYVPKVLAAFAVARGLCITPPELISDGCVFHLP
ncbi:lytic transglycosylase domain-containing protein [Oceanicola sp. S124]|uniref:lytic transglycosylase domain-containing protein n=1 Tax=Oceanicola sp. S124 TaxID=1042378 RepID=UPI0002558931|nr:lytic transglycosylase domain-containing protein [Oceanicola sp. S124]